MELTVIVIIVVAFIYYRKIVIFNIVLSNNISVGLSTKTLSSTKIHGIYTIKISRIHTDNNNNHIFLMFPKLITSLACCARKWTKVYFYMEFHIYISLEYKIQKECVGGLCVPTTYRSHNLLKMSLFPFKQNETNKKKERWVTNGHWGFSLVTSQKTFSITKCVFAWFSEE